jgi:hypothetical protein
MVLVILASLMAQAQSVPPLVNYQGMLTDASGNALTGTKKIEFNLYDAATGGNKVWGPQVFSSVPLVNGMFNVILGTTDTAGRSIAEAFGGKDRYLGIKVGDEPELGPRQQILSTPFAINADNANLLQNKSLDELTSFFRTPDYDSGWFDVQSNQDNTVTLTHNLGSFPARYTIQFSPTNPPEDYVYDVLAGIWYDNTVAHNSSIHRCPRFSKTEMEIPLWHGGYLVVYWQKTNSWLTWKTGYYRVMMWK